MDSISSQIEDIVELIGVGFDIFGVAAIVIGILAATARYVRDYARERDQCYRRYRLEIGLALLLGLEILLAADIIRTVALEPNFTNLGVLAMLILIRTFLSWALVVEIEGRWPWQKPSNDAVESGSTILIPQNSETGDDEPK